MLHSRRDVLKNSGAALTFGLIAGTCGTALPNAVSNRASALTILYPGGPFDFDYYRREHLKTMRRVYGASLERIELRRVVPPPTPPGMLVSPPAFSAAVNFWISNLGTFLANHQKQGGALGGDAAPFTSATPIVQLDTFQGALGAARSVPRIGERCLMFLFPNGAGVRWDADVYRTKHMPLIMQLYGEKAIRRFEVRSGERGATPGSKPSYLGLVNIYVADQAAMQAAGREHGARLMAENATFSSVDPTVFTSIIDGVS